MKKFLVKCMLISNIMFTHTREHNYGIVNLNKKYNSKKVCQLCSVLPIFCMPFTTWSLYTFERPFSVIVQYCQTTTAKLYISKVNMSNWLGTRNSIVTLLLVKLFGIQHLLNHNYEHNYIRSIKYIRIEHTHI